MSQTTNKIDYTKWGFILGIPIALVSAISAVIVVPGVGCFTGILPNTCPLALKEVEIISQTESGEPLAGVQIQVIGKGAPENQYTDSNGYAKVKIASSGDIRVNLIKSGYPLQNFIINLENSQTTTRIIRFANSGQPVVIPTPSTPTPTLSSSPNPVTPTPTLSSSPNPGDLGRLVSKASLLNDATWSVESSSVNRLLKFRFYVEAEGSRDKNSKFDATLFREGKEVCTISLNSKTSNTTWTPGVYADSSDCNDTLARNSRATYKAKVKVSEMTPIKIELQFVDASLGS